MGTAYIIFWRYGHRLYYILAVWAPPKLYFGGMGTAYIIKIFVRMPEQGHHLLPIGLGANYMAILEVPISHLILVSFMASDKIFPKELRVRPKQKQSPTGDLQRRVI